MGGAEGGLPAESSGGTLPPAGHTAGREQGGKSLPVVGYEVSEKTTKEFDGAPNKDVDGRLFQLEEAVKELEKLGLQYRETIGRLETRIAKLEEGRAERGAAQQTETSEVNQKQKERFGEVVALLENGYEIERRDMGCHTMFPFWLACAEKLFPLNQIKRYSLDEIGQQKFRGKILDMLGVFSEVSSKDSYVRNTSRMSASFNRDPNPKDQAGEDIDQALRELAADLGKPGETQLSLKASILNKLAGLRGRFGAGLCFLLPSSSTDIIKNDSQAKIANYEEGPEKLAWLAVSYSLKNYIEKHYGPRLIGE